MTLDQALVLGALQGLTEFLPVSSSGHLALAEGLLPSVRGPQLLFDVVVHLGTVGAIALVLRARLWKLLQAAVSLLPGRSLDPAEETERRWLLLIVVGSVPTAMIGLALRDVVMAMRGSPASVGVALLVTAFLLVVSERVGRRTRGPEALGMTDAVVIGVAQGLGVLPGLSRSGATIAAGLCRDARGAVAVEFSLLLSIPAVLGANLLEIARSGAAAVGAEIVPLAVGFGAAFGVGSVSLKALQWVVARRKLRFFAGYCVLAGVGAIVLG